MSNLNISIEEFAIEVRAIDLLEIDLFIRIY